MRGRKKEAVAFEIDLTYDDFDEDNNAAYGARERDNSVPTSDGCPSAHPLPTKPAVDRSNSDKNSIDRNRRNDGGGSTMDDDNLQTTPRVHTITAAAAPAVKVESSRRGMGGRGRETGSSSSSKSRRGWGAPVDPFRSPPQPVAVMNTQDEDENEESQEEILTKTRNSVDTGWYNNMLISTKILKTDACFLCRNT